MKTHPPTINQAWAKKVQAEFKKKTFSARIISSSPYLKYLIQLAIFHNRAFEVVSMGAGVRKFIIKDAICPVCKGKGFCL